MILGHLCCIACKKHAIFCPACNERFSLKIIIALKMRDGIYSCPKCGTLIWVGHKLK